MIVSRQRLVRDRLPSQCLHSIQASTGPRWTQIMRIQVEQHPTDHGMPMPRRLHFDGHRVDVLETLDQWCGPDYRYIKVRARWFVYSSLRRNPRRMALDNVQKSGSRRDLTKAHEPTKLSGIFFRRDVMPIYISRGRFTSDAMPKIAANQKSPTVNARPQPRAASAASATSSCSRRFIYGSFISPTRAVWARLVRW